MSFKTIDGRPALTNMLAFIEEQARRANRRRQEAMRLLGLEASDGAELEELRLGEELGGLPPEANPEATNMPDASVGRSFDQRWTAPASASAAATPVPEISGKATSLSGIPGKATADSELSGIERSDPQVPGSDPSNSEVPGQEMPGQEMPGQEMPGQEASGAKIPGSRMSGREMPHGAADRETTDAETFGSETFRGGPTVSRQPVAAPLEGRTRDEPARMAADDENPAGGNGTLSRAAFGAKASGIGNLGTSDAGGTLAIPPVGMGPNQELRAANVPRMPDDRGGGTPLPSETPTVREQPAERLPGLTEREAGEWPAGASSRARLSARASASAAAADAGIELAGGSGGPVARPIGEPPGTEAHPAGRRTVLEWAGPGVAAAYAVPLPQPKAASPARRGSLRIGQAALSQAASPATAHAAESRSARLARSDDPGTDAATSRLPLEPEPLAGRQPDGALPLFELERPHRPPKTSDSLRIDGEERSAAGTQPFNRIDEVERFAMNAPPSIRIEEEKRFAAYAPPSIRIGEDGWPGTAEASLLPERAGTPGAASAPAAQSPRPSPLMEEARLRRMLADIIRTDALRHGWVLKER